MAGRFEGLSDIEWKLFSNLFPVLGKREKGKPATDPRRALNMLLYLLFSAGTRMEPWLYSRLGF